MVLDLQQYPLSKLRWYRLRVDLVNIRMLPSSQEPSLCIMEAIIKGVSSKAGTAVPIFHITGKRHSFKINENTRIPLEIFFCQSDRNDVECWCAALKKYLSNAETGKNYDIATLDEIEERTLAKVTDEAGDFPNEGEICLDFMTPLPFEGRGLSRYFLSPDAFIRAFVQRFRNLFNTNIDYLPDTDNFSILPYYWDYAEPRHQSKSNKGSQLINGCYGKLYLRGSFGRFRPFLALGTELHAGGKLSNGQGYYKILGQTPPFFLKNMESKKLLLEAFRKAQKDQPDLFRSAKVHPIKRDELFVEELSKKLIAGIYEPSPNIVSAEKTDNGVYLLREKINPSDLVVQEHLHYLLYDVSKKISDGVAIGHRNVKWRATEKKMMEKAARKNLTFIVDAAIENLFALIDSDELLAIIEQCIPRVDSALKRILFQCVKAGRIQDGRYYQRKRGLPKESPLSPLLADIYLAPFDAAARNWLGQTIRYRNRVIFMANDEAGADAMIAKAVCMLGSLGLQLREEKRYKYT